MSVPLVVLLLLGAFLGCHAAFPGKLQSSISAKLTGADVITSSLASAGDPYADGASAIRVYSADSAFNIRIDFVLKAWTGPKAPLNQSIFIGPKGTVGTLGLNITGVWKYTQSSTSTKGSRRRLLAADDADMDASSDPVRRWIATRESKGVVDPSRAARPHGRSLKRTAAKEAPVSVAASTVVYDKIRLTSWLVGVASSNAVYAYVQNIVASPKLYYGQIVTQKYKSGACRGQFKKGITQIILGYIGKS